jgi:hypothetical protein
MPVIVNIKKEYTTKRKAKTQQRSKEVSGRSKPPFVVSGIQLCVIPGQVPGDPMVLF